MKIWSTFRGRRAGLILRLSRTSARDIPSDPPASRRETNECYIEILELCIPGGFCSFEILAPTKPHPAR
jgi:hypothetical protein